MSDSNKLAMPWDLLDPRIKHVPEKVYLYRYAICMSCDELRPKTKTCKKCNCYMKIKCALPHAECPLKKWSREK
jgi:hypothetical protein